MFSVDLLWFLLGALLARWRMHSAQTNFDLETFVKTAAKNQPTVVLTYPLVLHTYMYTHAYAYSILLLAYSYSQYIGMTKR